MGKARRSVPRDASASMLCSRRSKASRRPDGTAAPTPRCSARARAYLLLGNLYLDRGNVARAREVWNDGLGRFPGDGALDERLKALD